MSEARSHIKNIFSSLWSLLKIPFKGWNIWCFLNFSNLFKLIFLYAACVIWVMVLEFDTSKNFWSNSAHRIMNKITSSDSYAEDKAENPLAGETPNRRISIYSSIRIGEGMLYDRMIEYAKDNGYEYTGCKFWDDITSFPPINHIYYVAASVLNFLLEPDFNLALTHHVHVVPYGYNVTYLNMPRHDLFSPSNKFLKRWSHLNKYDAYVDLYTLTHGSNNILEGIAQEKPVIPIYLAERKIDYKPLEFNKALITGSLWGCSRGSLRMKLALKSLAEDDLLDAMGLDIYEYLGDHYLGKVEEAIKKDASIDPKIRKKMTMPDSLTYLQREYGISLLAHNDEHRLDGIPTARLAETAGSSSIMISDRNKFIEKHFSDSILFFDIDEDESVIYKQIKDHIKWIKENPQMAQAMARKSSEVFANNFSIEVQMDNLYSALNLDSRNKVDNVLTTIDKQTMTEDIN